jgi:hypothetical protein
MSRKQDVLRPSATEDPLKTLTKGITSDNVCYIDRLIRIRTRMVEDWSASERESIEARFWTKVNKDGANGCWLWTASCTGKAQHGQFTFSLDGRQSHVYAHRVSYELVHGPIPNGLNVCHHCDVPRCVNPAHLFLGTQNDNLNDARRKGRLVDGRHLIKVDDAGMADIRRRYVYRKNGPELATQYGISLAHVIRIVKGTARVRPDQRNPQLVLERVPHVEVPVRGVLHVGHRPTSVPVTQDNLVA